MIYVKQFRCKSDSNGDTPAHRIESFAKLTRSRILLVSVFEDEDTRQTNPGGYGTWAEETLLVVFESES